MFSGQNVLNALVLTLLVVWLSKKIFLVLEKKVKIFKSEIQGSEGKIITYHFTIFKTCWYVSQSETKWHLDDKYKKIPVWFSAGDGYPSIYVWKTALYYETKKMREIRLNKKSE